jgi:hypothetical protein
MPTPSATPTPTPTPSTTPSAAPSTGTHPVSSWFGVDPPVVLAGLLFIVLASIGFAAWRGFLRR